MKKKKLLKMLRDMEKRAHAWREAIDEIFKNCESNWQNCGLWNEICRRCKDGTGHLPDLLNATRRVAGKSGRIADKIGGVKY